MKTMRRLIYKEVLTAVAFVTLAFLGLFFFFDLVEDLQNVAGRHSPTYQLNHALMYVALLIPIHIYELMPITVLIGCIFVMARMAQSSEFTILRTSGMGPGQALRHRLTGLGGGAEFTARDPAQHPATRIGNATLLGQGVGDQTPTG